MGESASLGERLHFAWMLARRRPLPFLLAAGHRLVQPLQRRLRTRQLGARAARTFACRYPRAAAAEAWQRGLARILPQAVSRENYLRLWSATRAAVLAQAERICQHRFDLLGSGEVELGAEIDWHRDFKSGRRWPLVPAHEIQIVYPEDSSDIKVPWELARFQHLPVLGQAYWHTGENRYAYEFAAQVADWLDRNPFGMGPNWVVPMEAAIRGVNWLYAANCFGEAGLAPEFWWKLLGSLFAHASFIRANLEWNPYARGNHYLANLVGLAYLGAFFSDSPEGKAWLAFATRALSAEIHHQVGPDGTALEASLGYHRLVTELFLAGSLVAARAVWPGVPGRAALEAVFGAAHLRKLETMLDFILHYTRPDGRAPVVGDTDDGRLLELVGYGTAHPADHRHLLCMGALLFGRDAFAQAAPAGRDWEEAWWQLGVEPPAEGARRAPAPASRAFPAGGFFVMRAPESGAPEAYVLIRCGELSGFGGHAHCDQLSFELAVGRQPVLVDPGSYVYTADLAARYQFRSTASHNTVRVAGAEQNRISARAPFLLPDDTRARVRHWRSEPDADEFEGEHVGYERLPGRVRHRRAFLFDKRAAVLYILDRLDGRGTLPLEWFFHLAVGLRAVPRNAALLRPYARLRELQPDGSSLVCAYQLESAAGLLVPLFVFSPLRLAGTVSDAWVSERYGVKEKASVLSLRAEASRSAGPAAALLVFDLARR